MEEQLKTRHYNIKYCSFFKEPYWLLDKNTTCLHKSIESYTVDSLDLCKHVVKDFLDAPDESMTREKVLNDFCCSTNSKLDDGTIRKIIDYYNGRKMIYDNIIGYLDSGFTQDIDFNIVFPIKKEFNYFSFMDDEQEDLMQLLDAYVQIVSSTDDDIKQI